jgi:peptidoglycan/LPS O-acetylase OafA/YrhL
VSRTTLKQTLQFSALLIGFALLPTPVEAIAKSDVLFPMIGLTVLCAAAACAIFAWPVKR